MAESVGLVYSVLKRKRHARAGHGPGARRQPGQRARPAHDHPRTRAGRHGIRSRRWSWSARASRLTPAASASSRPQTCGYEGRHERRGRRRRCHGGHRSPRRCERRVIGVAICVENMPDGKAYRPADIVTGITGKTAEIISTDAEGRLVLADALGYVARYEPAAVVDLATLTGAIGVALGPQAAGLFANDDALEDALLGRSGPQRRAPVADAHVRRIQGRHPERDGRGQELGRKQGRRRHQRQVHRAFHRGLPLGASGHRLHGVGGRRQEPADSQGRDWLRRALAGRIGRACLTLAPSRAGTRGENLPKQFAKT